MFFRKSVDIDDFEGHIKQYAIQLLVTKKITSDPLIHFLKSADSLRIEYCKLLYSNKEIKSLKKTDLDRYLLVSGYHSLCAGAYVTIQDSQRNIAENAVQMEVMSNLMSKGALEIGLTSIWIREGSVEKRTLDEMMAEFSSAVASKYVDVLSRFGYSTYVNSYLNVCFNIGVTVAIRRIDDAIAAHESGRKWP